MIYIALLILGIISIRYFPVSLLPSTDIPEITIRINAPGMSARMVQNSITENLISQLRQVKHLEKIEAQSQNNQAFIKIRFVPGTKLNLSYIEVNEKVDAAMHYLPREIARPQVTKARLTDIPVFFLAVSYRKNKNLLRFSDFVSSVVKARIEQLPSIAMADISGLQKPEIAILPNSNKMKILGVTLEDLRQTLIQNNIELSNILLRQKQYEYFVKIDNRLATVSDLKKLIIKKHNHYFRLSDLCEIKMRAAKAQGHFYYNNQQAISISIIKNSEAKMADVKKQMKELFEQFQKSYPNIKFHLYRNQTALLDYSISNLQQSLILGILLAVLITFLFLRHWKYALLIGFTVPIALIISFLLLWLIHISINIISLSGLILAVGMMIDNAIIVVENIHQQKETGDTAIIKGTNEVIVPLLSSMFTTLVVFLPLIFIGGITQVLFYEQALTIAVGMLASFIVSITFLPLWYKKLKLQLHKNELKESSFWHLWYKKWHDFSFRHRKITIGTMLILVLLGSFLLLKIPKSLMPPISYHEMILRIKWNENISLSENFRRYKQITNIIDNQITEKTLQAGIPQYALSQKRIYSFYESEIYLNFLSVKALKKNSPKLIHYINRNYPLAETEILPAENIFNQIFQDNSAALRLNIYPADLSKKIDLNKVDSLMIQLADKTNTKLNLPMEDMYEMSYSPLALARYSVSPQYLITKLQTIFGINKIGELRNFSRQIPIRLSYTQKSLYQIINHTFLTNKNNEVLPLKALVKVRKVKQLKTIQSGMQGEFLPFDFQISASQLAQTKQTIRSILKNYPEFRYSFGGKLSKGNQILKSSAILFLLSLALLYIILAATFDSAVVPIVILIELPIDMAGIFIALWLGGEGLNMMSAIGIIVTAGIVINDSILKIDTINKLLERGMNIEKAISEGGRLRVNAILMTSATTILAILPMLFQSGMGVELQLPLVLAVIGGLSLGTLVSLFGIPLIYYYIKR